MNRFKTYNFIDITKKEFQQYQAEPITEAQAIEIQNNLFGVVELLLKWDKNTNNKQCAQHRKEGVKWQTRILGTQDYQMFLI